MTTLTQHLVAIGSPRPAEQVRYMSGGFDAGSLAEVFGDISGWTVGADLGEDWQLGCYARWPVYDASGERIGDLRDDASGYTFHDPLAD
jgi:hypothetical protein